MPHHHPQGRSMVPAKGEGEESVTTTWPAPSDLHITSSRKSTHRPGLSQSILAQPQTIQSSPQASNDPALVEGNPRNEKHSSNTWTSSSENPDLPSEEDGNDDREHFVLEYNRLAQRNSIRPIIPGDFAPKTGGTNGSLRTRQGSWLYKMLKQASEQPDKDTIRYQRGHSNVSLTLAHNHKQDGLKNLNLKSLIRLCGKSPLFLPTDYAPFSLTLPTCVRALAQALVQHADTRGIFRVPGSTRAVSALYDYYCTYGDTNNISSTTRCPMLPTHIRCNAHDIASTFKKFLAGLPGGILGSLSLFDALVAIHSQLQGNAELHWTKESKLRARLIALAIGTVRSQHQRELICAVFGLLCLVGRAAENAPREDENGHPLPTSDLMGYNALGIVFGPLLIGNMIDNYSMKVADPSAGLVLLPVSPPRSRKEKHGHKHNHKGKHRHRHRHAKIYARNVPSSLAVDKIHIANSITEMLIVHWREVVRQIRSTGSVKTRRNAPDSQHPKLVPNNISSSFSENFSLKNPPHLSHAHPRSVTPSTASPTPTSRTKSPITADNQGNVLGGWTPDARKAGISSLWPTQIQTKKATPHPLSPTIEESPSTYAETPEPKHSDGKATGGIVSERFQEPNPVSSEISEIRSNRAHRSGSSGVTNRLESIQNKPPTDVGSNTVRSQKAPKAKAPSPSLPLTQQYEAQIMPRRDAALAGSGQKEYITTHKAISSPSIKIDPPILDSGSFTEGVTLQHEYDVGISNPERTTLGGDQMKMSQMHSGDPAINEWGPSRSDIDGKRVSGKGSLESLPLRDTYYYVAPGNGSPSRSTMRPHTYERDHSRLMRAQDPSYALSGIQDEINRGGRSAMRSPAGQWKSLVASSKASTESLAKSAKDRRLKRSFNHVFPRPNREAPISTDPRPTTPERRRQLKRERTEPGDTSTATSPQKKTISEETPHSIHPSLGPQVKRFSPDKYFIDTPYKRGSQRSASKPMPGAVKAMTALFDNAAKESPGRSPTVLTGRTRNSLRTSNSFLRPDAVEESPTRSNPPRGNLSPNKVLRDLDDNTYQRKAVDALVAKDYSPTPRALTIRKAPNRPTIEDTPTRPLLRPVQMFSSARKEPQSSPNTSAHETDRNQPPRLGTMVPHEEEPPVGHFIRPSSATSARSRNPNAERAPPSLDRPDSRHASGNSLLHAQIRSLQRQLEMKNEEILQLRRQLETQEHIDIGTLCEQLRFAKRECSTWRKRAEAAEKRVAVFQRFSSKIQALQDGAHDDDGSPAGGGKGKSVECRPDEDESAYSVNTENREVFNDRIRHAFARKLGADGVGGDGAVFDEDFEGQAGLTRGAGGSEDELHRGRSRRTVRLWEAAQELFELQRDGSMCL